MQNKLHVLEYTEDCDKDVTLEINQQDDVVEAGAMCMDTYLDNSLTNSMVIVSGIYRSGIIQLYFQCLSLLYIAIINPND